MNSSDIQKLLTEIKLIEQAYFVFAYDDCLDEWPELFEFFLEEASTKELAVFLSFLDLMLIPNLRNTQIIKLWSDGLSGPFQLFGLSSSIVSFAKCTRKPVIKELEARKSGEKPEPKF